MFSVLKSAPYLPEISNSDTIKKSYKYWRLRILYSIYTGYLVYYFGRKSLNFITPYLIEALELTKSDIGAVFSISTVVYGISKFLSSILCDRSNPRYFMALGLMLSGVCNIFFGLSSSLFCFHIIWITNSFFQGWGWPACAKQLAYWFGNAERGMCWSICTTSVALGGFLVAYLGGYSAEWYGWRWGMYLPGILCIITSFWLVNRLRDVPQSLGLPPIENFKEDKVIPSAPIPTLSIKQLLFSTILNNVHIWLLAILFFCIFLLKEAFLAWGSFYLIEAKGITTVHATICLGWFETGAFFGILLSGFASDYWFQGKRMPLVALSLIILVAFLFLLLYASTNSVLLFASVLLAIGFLISVAHLLVGLASADFVIKKATSTSNGFISLFAYLGASIGGGLPLIKCIEIWSWNVFAYVLISCMMLSICISFYVWFFENAQFAKTKER